MYIYTYYKYIYINNSNVFLLLPYLRIFLSVLIHKKYLIMDIMSFNRKMYCNNYSIYISTKYIK